MGELSELAVRTGNDGVQRDPEQGSAEQFEQDRHCEPVAGWERVATWCGDYKMSVNKGDISFSSLLATAKCI